MKETKETTVTEETKDNLLRLEIKVEELERKSDKKKFNSYEVLNNEGRWIDLRFRQDTVKDSPNVTALPTENCILVCKKENVSVDKKRKYPRVWIHAIENIEQKYDPKESNKAVDDFLG